MRRSRVCARSSGIEKIDPPGLGTKGRAGRLDRREDGRGLRRRSQGMNSVVANPNEAHVAPAVVTLDEAAIAVAGRHINRAGVRAGRSSCADQSAGGKADTNSGAPVRMGLGAAAGRGKGGGERERAQHGGDLGLGHGGLHPVEFGRPAMAAICMGRAGAEKGSNAHRAGACPAGPGSEKVKK